MKLQHYLGGLEGLDEPITFEKRVFVEEWEKRIFGIHVAMMGLSSHLGESDPRYDISSVPSNFRDIWTWADLRKGAESMNPFDYFRFRYYEKWLGGISQFFLDNEYITETELDTRTATALRGTEADASAPRSQVERAGIDKQVIDYLRRGDSPRRDVAHARFAVGDDVNIADIPADDHTRLPGFLRGKSGVVERVFEGDYAYFCSTGPDGLGPAMPIYIVRFEHAHLWGARAEPNTGSLYAELFQCYLLPPKATT